MTIRNVYENPALSSHDKMF